MIELNYIVWVKLKLVQILLFHKEVILCAADHDFTQVDFPICAKKITIGEQVWVASDVFIAPGVTIGDGAVIGARSSVFKDMPPGMVCMGSPCKPIKERIIKEAE